MSIFSNQKGESDRALSEEVPPQSCDQKAVILYTSYSFFYKEKVLSRCLIFLFIRIAGHTYCMVETFWDEKMLIFFVEFHF